MSIGAATRAACGTTAGGGAPCACCAADAGAGGPGQRGGDNYPVEDESHQSTTSPGLLPQLQPSDGRSMNIISRR